jgi:hypothetical protein
LQQILLQDNHTRAQEIKDKIKKQELAKIMTDQRERSIENKQTN